MEVDGGLTLRGRLVDLEVQSFQHHLDGLRGQGRPGDAQLQLPHKGAPHAHGETQGESCQGTGRAAQGGETVDLSAARGQGKTANLSVKQQQRKAISLSARAESQDEQGSAISLCGRAGRQEEQGEVLP